MKQLIILIELIDIKKNIFWLCIFLSVNKIHSQSFYESYKNLTTPTQEEVDSIIKIAACTNTKEAAIIARDFSVQHFHRKDYSSAIHYARKEINILYKADTLDYTYSLALYQLGAFQYKNKEYLEAIKTFKKVISSAIDDIHIAKSNIMK